MSYSIKPVNFNYYKNLEDKKLHEQILFGSEREPLKEQADYLAKRKSAEKSADMLKKGFVATVATDVFVNGTLNAGKGLGTKALGVATKAGSWGGALGTCYAYDKAVKNIFDKSDSVAEATREHPFATAILYLSGCIASLTGMNYLYNKTKDVVSKNFPNQVASFKKGVSNAKKTLNNSWVGQKVVKPFEKISEQVAREMPTVARMAKKTAPYIPAGIMAYSCMKAIAPKTKYEQKEEQKIYQDLKNARDGILLKNALQKINELDKKTNALFLVSNNSSTDNVAKPDTTVG